MFEFKNGSLYIRQIDVEKLNVNIMSDLQQSYRTYLEETIYKDMAYLEELIQGLTGCENCTLEVEVKPIEKQTYNKTQVDQGNYYYPVIGNVSMNGRRIGREMEILRIPYMDDYGKINVGGSSKVVISVLRSSEDVSFTLKNNTFNIAMPYANIRIQDTKNGIKIIYGKQKFPIEQVIAAMLHEIHDETHVRDIFRNTHLVNTCTLGAHAMNRYAHSTITSTSDILKKYKSEQYRLGDTRDALNKILSIDRALGCTLSRPVDGFSYPEGTPITEDMIKEFKRARVNLLYVQEPVILTGYTLAGPETFMFSFIPAGTRNCELLRRKLPQYASLPTIPEDVQLDATNSIVFPTNSPLTRELAEFLLIVGVKEVAVHPGKTSKVIMYSFEREIVGNYTARLRDLTTDIPDGRSADEWVYFYNNGSLSQVDATNWLTPHDLIAIASVVGYTYLTKNTDLPNRDTSFLKKILMVNEIFSETLRDTMTKFVSSRRSYIAENIKSASSSNPFVMLTDSWISSMNANRYLSTVDSTNIVAEVSQVCHTTVPTQGEVVDEQRHLAIPYYGRICPFETPAGKKLGLVNTKAMGARVENGFILAPFRKVIGTSDGITISSRVTWLSVKDELGHKFGDQLSLKRDANGKILNTKILARIPNPDVSDEPFIFSTIMAYDLAGEYVDAYPEQFLSPTAAMVPFVCSNNAIRISYGVAQMRQAIYLLNSQMPTVRTEMYEDIFNYSDTDKYMAPISGTIESITNIQATIRGLDGKTRIVRIQNAKHHGQLDATVELFAKTGERVREGQVIAEVHKYPQPFVVRAPYAGRIARISDDCIQIDKNSSGLSSFVNLEDQDTIAIENSRIMGQSATFLNLHVSVGDYVEKGQILADTCMSRGGVYTPARNPIVAYISTAYNYEDGIHAFESAAVNYTSLITHTLEHKISRRHVRSARLNSLQGFKYCGPGDDVGTVTLRDDSLDQNRTHKVKADLKHNGIPYERKTIRDDGSAKIVRYNLLGFKKLQPGDKMSGGGHGNKGVVSVCMPDSKAPQLANGRTVEFCLNPCGVPSRMNLGQIWHAHLGLVAEVLGIPMVSNAYNGATREDIELLMNYTWELANTEALGNNTTRTYNSAIFQRICDKYPTLPKEVHEIAWNNIERIIDWRGVFDRKGDAKLYDPETGTYFNNPITIGCPTMLKLMQEADEKQNSRAGMLEEGYARTTSQPLKGDNSAKGQRMAEMELVALVANGCSETIREVLNEKSDNEGLRINKTLDQIDPTGSLGFKERLGKNDCVPRATENLLYFLEALGVKLDVPDVDVSLTTSANKETIDVRRLISERLNTSGNGGRGPTDTMAGMDAIKD